MKRIISPVIVHRWYSTYSIYGCITGKNTTERKELSQLKSNVAPRAGRNKLIVKCS